MAPRKAAKARQKSQTEQTRSAQKRSWSPPTFFRDCRTDTCRQIGAFRARMHPCFHKIPDFAYNLPCAKIGRQRCGAEHEPRLYRLRRRSPAGGRRCGARGRQGHSKDHDQPGNRDAGRRLSAVRQRLCRNHERGRSGAFDPAAQHQGQQREHSAAGKGRDSISRWSPENPPIEAFMGIGRPRDPTENPDRDLFQPRHVRGARGQPVQDHSRSRRPPGRVRRARLGPADPVALHARRSRR